MLHFLITQFYLMILLNKVLPFNLTEYTISTEGCKIPRFPLISDKIAKFVKPSQRHTCYKTELVISNSSHIWVSKDSFDDYYIYKGDEFYCCYRNFLAFNIISNITYGSCKYFTDVIKAEHEFVRVKCYYYDDEIYKDFFIFHMKDMSLEITSNSSYNILILGIESMSRMNFHRTMPKTLEFLKKRNATEMLGYDKIGDNSFPNLFPLLTGKSFSYAKENCIKNYNIDTKKCKFVWDKYKEIGYKTVLGSDSISGLLGTYEHSFLKIPTDYYLQPFIDETMDLLKNKNYNFHMCFRNQYYYKLLLNYAYGIVHKLREERTFSIFWEESVSHDFLNKPKIMDNDYINFLNKLETSELLNRTILIFLSDHGMRWGSIVRTEQGRQEERLPLLLFLLPEQFKNQYKIAFQNLQINSNRLITAFDFHKTLLHLLQPDYLKDYSINIKENRHLNNNGNSLFLPITEYRTCESIGIENHWCTCIKGKKVAVGSKTRYLASKYVIDNINQLLSRYPQCHKLYLKNILQVRLTKNSENKERIITTVVKAFPGEGIFDATVHGKRGKWIISGTVSRLNSYRNSSYCVENEVIKLYCYCKYIFFYLHNLSFPNLIYSLSIIVYFFYKMNTTKSAR